MHNAGNPAKRNSTDGIDSHANAPMTAMTETKIDAEPVLARLAELVSARTDTALAEALGINRGTLSSWRSRAHVPLSWCHEIAARNGWSLEWLLHGIGPRHLEELRACAERPADPYADYLQRHYRLIGKGGIRIGDGDDRPIPFPENSVPIAFQSDFLAELGLKPDSDLFGLACKDDAMEPTIRKGWCVLVYRQLNAIADEGIYAILMRQTGRQTLRRITPMGDSLHLCCDNPLYDPMTVDMRGAPLPIAVMGRVVWSGGPLFDG